MYQKYGTINRTDEWRFLWLTDRQALPPRAWCLVCGSEVYTPDRHLCRRCDAFLKEELLCI